MIKSPYKTVFFWFFSMVLLIGFWAPTSAAISISYLELENMDWIAPNASQIRLGLEPEFAFHPDGTMEIVYLDPEAYSDDLLYIDNNTGSWSDPQTIAEPQYGAMNPQILVDTQNVTHISYRADAGGAYHLNGTNGVFSSESMGGGQLMSSVPRMVVGPDGATHFVYYWFNSGSESFSGGITYINNTDHVAHNTNNAITRFEQRPDIAVDSTGMVHIVYEGSWNNTALGSIAVRDIFYQTFNPFVSENPFSTPIRLTDVQSTGDYAQLPSILCDENDNLHVVLIETEPETSNGYLVHRAYVKYMRIDADPSSADLHTVNTIRASTSYPRMAVDTAGDVHIVFVGTPQTEFTHNYESDVIYTTNKTGSWVNERITNQPYTVGWPRIAIHPTTDQPVILYLIKQAYSVDAYMMEFVEYHNGSFGNHFSLNTLLSAPEDYAQVIHEEAYDYILLTANQPITLTVDMDNPLVTDAMYNLDFQLIENDFVSLVNGSSTQTVSTLGAGASTTLFWNFQVARGQTSELEVQILQNEIVIGKIIYIFNIGQNNVSIPFASVEWLSTCLIISALLLIIHQKRNVNRF